MTVPGAELDDESRLRCFAEIWESRLDVRRMRKEYVELL